MERVGLCTNRNGISVTKRENTFEYSRMSTYLIRLSRTSTSWCDLLASPATSACHCHISKLADLTMTTRATLKLVQKKNKPYIILLIFMLFLIISLIWVFIDFLRIQILFRLMIFSFIVQYLQYV